MLVAHRLHFLRQQGYKRALVIVIKDNVPALKVEEKLGYTNIGDMHHTRLLLWDIRRFDIQNIIFTIL